MIHLFHYAKEPFEVLKTLKAQGKESTYQSVNVEWSYSEHISFFVDPIPADIMGRVYGKDHKVWSPGSELYEHQVIAENIGPFNYRFCETPEWVELYYDPKVTDEEFPQARVAMEKRLHYKGSSLSEFKLGYAALKGKTRTAILEVPKKPDWIDIRDKYAARVPHVMLYPAKGEVKVLNSRKITIK